MSFSYELITRTLPPRTLYEHIGTTHAFWCLESDFAASHMEEDCSEAIERYEAEEAADKEVTGPHTPLHLQKVMVTMAPSGG